MNKAFKRTLNIIAIALCVCTMNIVALAQGTTMIAVSKESPAVGDKVTVSVTASESGTITVKYTASMLNLVSCTGKDYTASGNFITFTGKSGDVVFNAASAGTASVIISSTTCSGSSTNITIGGGSSDSTETTVEEKPAEEAPAETAAEEPVEQPVEEAPAETPEVAAAPSTGAVGTLNANGGFDINGVSYVVSERYADSEVPSGFEKKTITIGSSTYSEPVNGNVTLLYLKPADNVAGSGVFYSYNADEGTVSQFLMLNASNDLIMLSDAGEPLSSAFQNIALDVTGGSASVYTLDGGEFYYLYGTNKAGTTGWFVYDSANNTVSRVDESLVNAIGTGSSASDSEDSGVTSSNDNSDLYINKLNTYRKVIMGLIVLCVLLVFVIINSLVKSRDRDDDFDGDVFATAPKKSVRKLPRPIAFGNPLKRKAENDDDYEEEEEDYDEAEEEYYEDGDYDEYEEEVEEEPSISPAETVSNYDARRSSSLNMMDLNDL
ncbi:hypothetical protein SAMN02910298_01577 [Pseudobutyrivibrio sp. YE44]|uniref:hypothetical protein n=1 Tax=Pseudobutyrivibrio sp. YE44 TaxID=1520802 RepID=UPI0008872000|nr:hypothetical protein [Pseudobutyrivibrio sp. YE44]SDB32819.1 hypothetical protein SAMN02910298_01577 [Pseudobutyrivibrio sp. YE44]